MMRLDRMGAALVLAAGLAILPACAVEDQAAQGDIVKGGDDRTGGYTADENWWKPRPGPRRRVGVGAGVRHGGGHPGPDHRSYLG